MGIFGDVVGLSMLRDMNSPSGQVSTTTTSVVKAYMAYQIIMLCFFILVICSIIAVLVYAKMSKKRFTQIDNGRINEQKQNPQRK